MDKKNAPAAVASVNWASLSADGPLHKIGECLLANEQYADTYSAMRQVCRNWRSGLPEPDVHLHEWIMLDHGLPRAADFTFLHLRTSRYVTIDLTEVHARYYFVGFCRGVIVLAQKNQPHKIRLLNPLTKTLNTMFEAHMPNVILKSVAVMKSPTMVFVSKDYPAEIAWVDESTPTKGIDEDWGEGRFSIEHHCLRCITPFNGELYAIAVNNFEFGKLVCTNNVQLEQRASTVKMDTLFSFPELGNNKFYLVESDGALLLVLLDNKHLEEGQPLVYRVDTESRSLHAVNNIGSRAFFVHYIRCISVDTRVHPTLRPGCIYYTDFGYIREYFDDIKAWDEWPIHVNRLGNYGKKDDAEELLAKIGRNHDDWSTIEPTPTPIVKKRGMIKLNDEDMREAKKSLKEKGIKPEDVKNLPPIEDLCEITPPSSMIEDPLYPEGHPKRVEQDSQLIKTSAPSKKKKKKHKNVVESSEPVNDPNSISISDAETESGNEHDKDNDKDDTPDKEEIEKEPEKHAKNKKYTKEDFITEKHGAVIDCNKGMVTFNVDDKEHTVYFPKRIDKKGKMKKFKFGELFKKATTSTGRPSRASTQIRRSYNEDVIAPSFAPEEDNGAPNASSFPCYEFLTNAGILDDFFTLVNRAGLATYVGDEREQYYRLTKVFVESFKFHNAQFEPTVAFKIYDIPVTMKLEEFCRALDIAPVGTARRIDDNPRDLLELYRGITEDDCRTIQRGKIRNIQLPAIKYFAYYIATSILGRENTSNISSYHLAFLNVALTGETSYHLGSLIARRLSSRGPIFGGTIALRILTHLEIPLDSNDVPLTPRRLDIAAMKSHHFVTTDSTIDNMVYRMLFADGNEKEIPLPQPGLFNIDRQSWSLTKEAVEEHMKIQEFHQQHDSENAEPSYDYTVTYPDVSSSTYLEPGRSSSYYGDTTSWGPWE
ncbi:hypothetical protein QYE76_047956 [Lolium multiflorum]|uniref:DUF295 domain-containing protein n=1 Tax=Lolium multiflorum TaxID=4521 RepID=A0AAD8X2F2_LOLMU|nr:hypothetical protein QYE76_047956 [Lolium multiflorum]